MAIEYQFLKDADARLSPAIPDPAAAAAALNRQTRKFTVDVTTTDARAILLASGEYAVIKLLSEVRDYGTTPRELVLAGITAITTLDSNKTVLANDSLAWAGVLRILGVFVDTGLVSPITRDGIVALRQVDRPIWPVVLTANDIIAARNLR